MNALPLKGSFGRRPIKGFDESRNVCGVGLEASVHNILQCPTVAEVWEVSRDESI